MLKRDEPIFFEVCEEARRLAFSFKDPVVVHHYDADGISSGSIVLGSFLKQNQKVRQECIKKLDDEAIDHYAHEREVIFVDLGGGNKRVNELKDIIIIDHHQTQGIEKFQVNPLLFGIDGGTEMSAAGTAYCVFKEYVDLAIVGAVGDMQHPLKGMNRKMLKEGVERGEVKIENDLKFYGRYSRPLPQFLTFCDDPILPGISFQEEKAQEFLLRLGIPAQNGSGGCRTYADLDQNEKQTLVSALTTHLTASGLRKIELIGENYVFPKRIKNETYEAGDFTTILNACGRHGRADVGIRICLGEKGAQGEGQSLLQLHRKMLKDGIDYALKATQDFGLFHFIDGRGIVEEGIIGIVCGMSLQEKIELPIIGIALGDKESIKVSGRASKQLVARGLNLGEIMRKASEGVDGIGGGHRMAAGANIPANKINEFLLLVGQELKL